MSDTLFTPTLQADGELSRGVVYRALARDAYLQVADNLVFRIMLVLVLVMVACTFVIGFRDDHISILFGVTRIEYETVLGGIGGFFGVIGSENRSATFVEQIQSSFATSIAGSFGALFSVVATSFFVPRMLEKGAADTLFSKPVTRGVLVLSRWFGAIVFVAILASVLVFGMWAGFAIASGYTSPRFLWAAPMLIYQFALLSAISTFFGALTRSSIATLLLTVLSWWACVAVHAVWLFAFEFMPAIQERGIDLSGRERSESTDDTEEEAPPVADDDPHPFVRFLDSAVTFGHYVLPKTGDAAELTELVRKTLHGENRTLLGGIEVRGQTLAVHGRADGAIVVRSPEGNEALFENGRGKLLEMDARRPMYVRVSDDGKIEAWTVSPRDARRAREEKSEAAGTESDAATEPLVERPVELPAEAVPADIVSAEDVDFGITDPTTFYRTRFTWEQSDLGYSPQFSFFSSLGFSALLLILAIWRVRRIDF